MAARQSVRRSQAASRCVAQWRAGNAQRLRVSGAEARQPLCGMGGQGVSAPVERRQLAAQMGVDRNLYTFRQ